MTTNKAEPRVPPVGTTDHIRGPKDAPVTLIEYGDFECPQCGEAYPIVKEIEQFFGDRLRVIFRHFPLTNIHPHAQRAAEAAEWAASFGAFWPMHDALYENRDNLEDRNLQAIAGRLGLTPGSLVDAWGSHHYFARVKEHFLAGIRGGVKGTPTFFINEVRYQGGWDALSLGRAIREALPVNDQAAGPRDPGLVVPGAGPPR